MPALLTSPVHAAPRRETAAPRWQEQPDEAVLGGYSRSDPGAASEFVARFGRRVYGLAYTMLSDSRAAEDVAQEALLRAWRHAATFDVRRGSVAAWLMTIARNLAVDAARLRRPATINPDELLAMSPAAPDHGPAEVAVLRDDVRALRDALGQLPEAQRRAVVLAGVWGLTAREIAERDGTPIGTVKTRIRTALLRLRRLLSEDPEDHHDRDDAPMAEIVRNSSLLR